MPQLSVSFSAVAKLLGRFWLNEIDLEMLQAIAAPEFRESFEELGGFVPDPVNSTVVEQLAVEYCSLLVGPQGHISPVESVWSENQFEILVSRGVGGTIIVNPVIGHCYIAPASHYYCSTCNMTINNKEFVVCSTIHAYKHF